MEVLVIPRSVVAHAAKWELINPHTQIWVYNLIWMVLYAS